MPRSARVAPGGFVYHVVNRANGRVRPFRKEPDFRALYNVLLQTHAQFPIRVLSWCVMASHWYLVVWPREEGELSMWKCYIPYLIAALR